MIVLMMRGSLLYLNNIFVTLFSFIFIEYLKFLYRYNIDVLVVITSYKTISRFDISPKLPKPHFRLYGKMG